MMYYPAGIFLFNVNDGNIRTIYKICSKLTTKTPEQRQWRRSGVFIINFEQISHIALVFPLLTLRKKKCRMGPQWTSDLNWAYMSSSYDILDALGTVVQIWSYAHWIRCFCYIDKLSAFLPLPMSLKIFFPLDKTRKLKIHTTSI